ncbi:MAG: hypothetical protein LBT22_08975 [Peptococcaceae bacterium]|nr:hypothetical protein [Peptococcaceae bacterium]
MFDSGLLSDANFLVAMAFILMGIISIVTYWLLKCFTGLRMKRRYGITLAVMLASFGYPIGIWSYLNIRRFSWWFIVMLLIPVISYFLVQPDIPDED